MADNPLKPDADREHRIRERAYHLWEQDGRPHGRDQEYWERARELIGMEDNPDAGELPNPMNHPDSPRETGIEEAQIQENLGEFPDRFADQGEVQQTPSAAHHPRARLPAEAAAAPELAPRKQAAKNPAAPPAAALTAAAKAAAPAAAPKAAAPPAAGGKPAGSPATPAASKAAASPAGAGKPATPKAPAGKPAAPKPAPRNRKT